MSRNTFSRTAALLALGIAATTVLTSCTQGSATNDSGADSGTTTIRYMGFMANDGHEQDLAAIVEAFEAENPGIKVNVETVPYADYFTKLQTSIAGQSAADVIELNYENFVSYGESGALAPLTTVDASVYQDNLLDSFKVDGTQYAVPASYSNVVLYYNKELFDAAGVSYPTADWTWADEQAAATSLTDIANGVYGDVQAVSFHEFYKALAQAGGQFFNDDKTATAFNSPEGIAAATWLVSKPGTTMPTEAEGSGTPGFDQDLFIDGKLAMWHSGIWMFTPLTEGGAPDWDIVVEPGDTTKASALFANAVAVTAGSTHKDAAEKFAQYVTSSTVAVDTRISSSWELPPVADTDVLEPYLAKTPPANRQAVLDSLDNVVLPPVIASQQEMQDALNNELSAAAAGRKTVEQALTDAAAAIDPLLK